MSNPNHSSMGKISNFFGAVSAFFRGIGSCLYKLRKFIMAFPVIYALTKLTIKNYNTLPNQVGMFLQKNGDYSLYITKEFALFAPVGITVFCLLMMFASKKTLEPWVISIFSLALPLLFWVTNIFPS